MERVDKINYYLNIAEAISERGTCLRKNYGAIIVKNDEFISTGYTGAPRGRKNCIDLGYCVKKKFFPDVRHGGYDACQMCRKLIINSGIKHVYIRINKNEYYVINVSDWVNNDDLLN